MKMSRMNLYEWKASVIGACAGIVLAASFASSQQAPDQVKSTTSHPKYVATPTVVPDVTSNVTTTGGTLNYLPVFSGTSTIVNSEIVDTGTSVGIGDVPNPAAKLDINGEVIMRGSMQVSRSGNATASKGYPSYPFEFYSNVYNSSLKTTQNPFFELESEPVGNDTASPSSTFNLLYVNGETGFYINPNGAIHFSPAQTFPIAAGPQGPAGPAGPTGPQGPAGPASTLTLPFTGLVDGAGITLFYVENKGTSGGGGIEGVGAEAFAEQFSAGGNGVGGAGGSSSSTVGETYGGTGVTGYGGIALVSDSLGGNGGYFVGGYGYTGSTGGDGVDAYAGGSADANEGGTGLYASANDTGFNAGDFNGNVFVGGNLSKSGGSFKIDHPLDPENKYLSHSFVESPDMKNIYDGVVITDGDGTAVVTLPDWFEALNRDFRYQLTPLGQFAQAMVASEISNGKFTIRTDKGNVKVSWQVTGIRQDAWANAHRIPVEEEKSARDKGHYLTPELFGQTREQGIMALHHPTPPNMRRAAKVQP